MLIIFSLDVIRLGLFLVYTLPPSSNTTESGISDDDLLQDIPGTRSKQHVSHLL